MSRLLLEKNTQKTFLEEIHTKRNISWSRIARFCNICERTLRDWRNEKFIISYKAALNLSKIAKIPIPQKHTVLPEYWSTKKAAKKGALRRYEKYGNPGTADGRRKGGLVSQAKFRSDPEYAKRIGVVIRKEISRPADSSLLAEFIGIMLGDGGIAENQTKITFNRVTDKNYAVFIKDVVKKLFNISSTVVNKKCDKGSDIVISSRNLIDFLINKGLMEGSKIKNRIDVPTWIFDKDSYKIHCIRGLIDTDGSFYLYKHRVNNKMYTNFSMCFTNYSGPLIDSAYKMLKSLGFSPVKTDKRVYLNKRMDIDKYFDIIGSSNPKHLGKYKKWMGIRAG
ncbi:MAG: LAGLIDADG family homing endonuclease [Candidatus Omnitrophota bacterium]|nr:LAGLIDADG family homing endonuclease [Candidatus Omnitrophota bacterium]